MEKEMTYYYYTEYWKKKLYSNIEYTHKYIPYIYLILMVSSSYYFTGGLQLIFLILPIIYFSIVKFLMALIKKKIFKDIESYVGVFIFFYMTIQKLVINYHFHKLDSSLNYTFPMAEAQYVNFIHWLFINNFKISFICEVLNISIQVFFNYYWFGFIPDNIFFVDMITSCIFYMSICCLVEQLHFKLYLSLSMKLTNTIRELSKGMDNLSEHLVILNIDESKNISLYHSSAKFTNKYMNVGTKTENSKNPLEGLFGKFSYASKHDIEQEGKNKPDSSYSFTLLKDLNDFIDENKRNSLVNYKKNIYSLQINTDNNIPKEYFEINFTIFNAAMLRHEGYNKKSILMLIKSIDYDTYQMKNQQITDFGNIIISSLTQELKNPLNALYGQLYMINKQNISNNKFNELIEKSILIDKPTLLNDRSDQDADVIKHFKNNYDVIESMLDKHKENSKVLGDSKIRDVRTLLLCKYYNSNVKSKRNMKFSKYIKSKLKLILANFEIFSKLKLKLLYKVKMNEINLSYLFNKCLKILYPIVELNNNKLKIDTEITNFCLIKTDPHIFKILVKNIILLLEKRTKSSNLEIKVEVKRGEDLNSLRTKNPPLQIQFIATDAILEGMYDNKVTNSESMDLIGIFNKNNNRLAKLIDCVYEETYKENMQYLKYSLSIPCYKIEENYIAGNEINFNVSSRFALTCEADNSLSQEYPDNLSKEFRSQSIPTANITVQPVYKTSLFLANTNIGRSHSNNVIDIDTDLLVDNSNPNEQQHRNKIFETNTNRIDYPNNDEDGMLIQKPLARCNCFRVLLVDNDSINISCIVNAIKGNKEKYEIAHNGQDAFNKVKKLIDLNCDICENKFLLIFMDVYIPILHGVNSTKMIDEYVKRRKNEFQCKLYFISANIDSKFINLLKKISICAGFIDKPIKRSEILDLLNEINV